jgi:hypothetical protein
VKGAQNVPGVRGKPFAVGADPRRGTSGGRPKALRDIEAMLNAEHRTVESMREVFATVKALALRGEKGDSGYLKLYLERVLGPVKDLDDLDELLKDAPPEAIEFLRGLVH